mmetsp:Transcript_14693/g.59742  ORF Transcript_14693/g.59742 Transcript_14693/m.59742 type:complete len:83 (-) Transcript_14693:3221-3469(-)
MLCVTMLENAILHALLFGSVSSLVPTAIEFKTTQTRFSSSKTAKYLFYNVRYIVIGWMTVRTKFKKRGAIPSIVPMFKLSLP